MYGGESVLDKYKEKARTNSKEKLNTSNSGLGLNVNNTSKETIMNLNNSKDTNTKQDKQSRLVDVLDERFGNKNLFFKEALGGWKSTKDFFESEDK